MANVALDRIELKAKYQAKQNRDTEIVQSEQDGLGYLPEAAKACTIGELMQQTDPGHKLAEIGRLLQQSTVDGGDEALAVALKYSLGGQAGDEQMLRIQSQVLNGLFLHYTSQMLQARTPTELLEFQRVALRCQSLCTKTVQVLSQPTGGTTVIKQANVANGPQQINNT